MPRPSSALLLALTTATLAATALPAQAAGSNGPALAHQGTPMKVTTASVPPPILYSLASDTRSEVDRLDPLTGKTTRIASTGGLLTAAAWSNNTGRYYYDHLTLGSSAATTKAETDEVAESGGAPHRVIDGSLELDISPDGKTYVFVGKNGQLYTEPNTGGTPTRLTGAGGVKPRFSPDGTRIVFTRIANKNSDVYTIGTDGKGLTRITAASAVDVSGAYSPDGSRLVFTRVVGKAIAIYSVGANGKGLRLVVRDAADPDWAANGWLTYLVPDDNDTAQIAVQSPGVPGKVAVLTKNGLDTLSVRFKSGIAPTAQ